MPGPLYLLGPQRPEPNLPEALASVPGDGPVVYITAGWRNDEGDDDALRRDVGQRGWSLPIYQWFEELAQSAPDLWAAHHQQMDEIRALKRLYRVRLDPALEAVRELMAQREANPELEFVNVEIEDALGVLKGLRERFVAQCDAVRAKFADRTRALEHTAVRERYEQIRNVLFESRAVLIAGGHVGVLRNRLEFFGMGPLLKEALDRGVAVIAWSAGAMAMTEKVVLFHDDPPTGQSNPEVLDRGLGLARDIVCLPHARQRLWLDDAGRVSLMASRFAPDPCVGMENGAWLVRDGDADGASPDAGWVNRGAPDTAVRLLPDGTTRPLATGDAGEGDDAPGT